MKRISIFFTLSLLAVALAAVLLFCELPLSASAEEEESVGYSYITGNYYEFGTLFCADSCGGTFAAIEDRAEEGVFLRVISPDRLVKLSVDRAKLSVCKIVVFEEIIYIYSGEKLFCYSVPEDTLTQSSIPVTLTLDISGIGTYEYGFTAMTADKQSKLLIVDYQSILVFYNSEEGAVGKYNLRGRSFDNIFALPKVGESVAELHCFDSANGSFFKLAVTDYTSGDAEMILEPTGKTALCRSADETQKIGYSPYNGGVALADKGVVFLDTLALFVQSGSEEDGKTASADALCWDGELLYVVDNGAKAVKVFNKGGTLVKMYGANGKGLGDNKQGLLRLSSPSLLSASEQYIAVYDRGNGRIVCLSPLGEAVSSVLAARVDCMCLAGEKLVYSDSSFVYVYDIGGNTLIDTFPISRPASVLSYDGTNIYAVMEGKVHLLKNGGFVSVATETAGGAFCGKHEGVLYTADENGFVMYKGGRPVITLTDVLDYESCASDYLGNMWLLNNNKLLCYTRSLNLFQLSEYKASREFDCISITDGGKIYALTGSAVACFDLSAGAFSDQDFFPELTHPFRAIKTQQTSWAYQRPDNYETVVSVEGNKSYVLFGSVSYNGAEYYCTEMLKSGEYVTLYLPVACAELLDYREYSGVYVKYAGIDLVPHAYVYPAASADAAEEIDKGKPYEIKRLVGYSEENGWEWYQLDIDGESRYIEAVNYVVCREPLPEVQRYYARAKATYLGRAIPIYLAAEEGAEVLCTVTDGAKIELTAPYDPSAQYTQIRIDDKLAYIRTASVKERGLTGGQLFAICFGSAVVGLTIGLLLLSAYAKRKKTK